MEPEEHGFFFTDYLSHVLQVTYFCITMFNNAVVTMSRYCIARSDILAEN